MKKQVLICVDRDGTLIYDDRHYHLGRQRNWKSLIQLLPEAVHALAKLQKSLARRKDLDVKYVMITNQPGISILNFPLLTQKRAEEVCRYVIRCLAKEGVRIDDFFICPHPTQAYMRSHPQFRFARENICTCRCVKPKPGMIYQALGAYDWNRSKTTIVFIGDRVSDVRAGINAGGIGILLPFSTTDDQDKAFIRLKQSKSGKRAHACSNFMEATKIIEKKLK